MNTRTRSKTRTECCWPAPPAVQVSRCCAGSCSTAAAVPAGVFGAARLRQRGYFPSLFALQFGLVPDRRRGPGRFKWTCFAFLEEPAVQSATHRERVAMRRMRAGILSVGTLLFFFLCFG